MIHDGYSRVLIPRYDLDRTAHICARVRLRRGYAIVLPLKNYHTGERPGGLHVSKQDGVPTAFAAVVAVSPFETAPTPVKVGDVIMRRSYAAQPLHVPTLGLSGADETLAPMERSSRGLQIMSIRDVIAIL